MAVILKQTTTQKLGIDLPVKAVAAVRRRLEVLRSTMAVDGPFTYREDRTLCQLHVDTTMTEEQLDDWCYKSKCVDYIGVFVRTPA